VDRRLIEEGRLRRLERPEDVELVARERGKRPPMRDPDLLLDAIVEIADGASR
jgi:hypothetical protein